MKRSVFWNRIRLLALVPALCFAFGCARPLDAPEAPPAPAASALPAPTAAAPAPTPSPAPDALTAADGVYTFAWMSDTQYYSSRFPDVYHAMTEFLASSRERLNLQYVIHTGDIVSWADRESDWTVARHAMAALDGIPCGVLAGNHDVTTYADRKSITYEYFTKHFGESEMRKNTCCTDVYENGRGHVDEISAGKTDYAFCYMGYPVDENGAAWLNAQLAARPDSVGVLCVHDYFDRELALTEQGHFLFDNVVTKNDNLYMVLCGHRYNSRTVPVEVENADGSSRTVLQSITNYQAAGREGGSGYIRFMQVDERAGMLSLINYSPLLNDYSFFDDPENFADPYYFDPAGERELVEIPWAQSPASPAKNAYNNKEHE